MMTPDEMTAWLSARSGKLTASRVRDALAVKKNGEPTAERSKLQRELLAERVTGSSVRHFVTPAMQDGLDYEDEAKAAYEAHTGELISAAGFYDHPSIDMCGASPDGLLGQDGLIETKVPTTTTFVEWMLAGVVPPEHIPQMVMQLACTGRKYCMFVAYSPRIKNPAKRLFIRKFVPTPEQIAEVEGGAEKFLAELDAMENLFREAA